MKLSAASLSVPPNLKKFLAVVARRIISSAAFFNRSVVQREIESLREMEIKGSDESI